MNDGFVRLYMF